MEVVLIHLAFYKNENKLIFTAMFSYLTYNIQQVWEVTWYFLSLDKQIF